MPEEVGYLATILLSEIFIDDDLNEGRGKISPADVVDLAKDIDINGLIQPVILAKLADKTGGKLYRLIAGYRRTVAHIVLGRESIQAIVRPPMTEAEARLLNLSENVQRKNLDMVGEARALKRLKELRISREDVARRLNVSPGWVQVRYMLLDLPELVQTEVATGIIKQTDIRSLHTVMRHEGDARCIAVTKELKEKKLKGCKRVEIKTPLKRETKHQRNKQEILNLMFHIQEFLPNGLYTRVLAWAAGEISDPEVYESIKIYATSLGREYSIPVITETTIG